MEYKYNYDTPKPDSVTITFTAEEATKLYNWQKYEFPKFAEAVCVRYNLPMNYYTNSTGPVTTKFMEILKGVAY